MPGEQGYRDIKIGPILFGEFLAEVINFLILALAIYIFIVKIIGPLMKKKDAPAPPPGPTKEEQLLTEIRDLLKAKN